MNRIKLGDFTQLARYYHHRPGYSERVLRMLADMTGAHREGAMVADVGAGTGKLTGHLDAIGLQGFAVEPNNAMRREAIKETVRHGRFAWCKGTAEATGLKANSVDWVLMGSSFHWADAKKALPEFHRILKPGGFFTAVWNPRDTERSPVDHKVEAIIREVVPDLKRVSSGASQSGLEERLLSTGHFHRVLFAEAPHVETMTRARYLGVWQSVNDIQAQAGSRRFAEILRRISRETKGMSDVRVAYRTRAWTVQAVEK